MAHGIWQKAVMHSLLRTHTQTCLRIEAFIFGPFNRIYVNYNAWIYHIIHISSGTNSSTTSNNNKNHPKVIHTYSRYIYDEVTAACAGNTICSILYIERERMSEYKEEEEEENGMEQLSVCFIVFCTLTETSQSLPPLRYWRVRSGVFPSHKI